MVARLKSGEQIIREIWQAVRNMIEPELTLYQSRFPRSRRCAILTELAASAAREDEEALGRAGMDYMILTRTVPPGCYAVCETRHGKTFLAGQRVKRRRGDVWAIRRYSPQVWR